VTAQDYRDTEYAMPALAGKYQEIFMAAIFALHAGKAVVPLSGYLSRNVLPCPTILDLFAGMPLLSPIG